MTKRMLIDASHPEETRVVVLSGNRVGEFDYEAQDKKPLKGNIYLAKVTRVEPSLQAAFVDYGGNRNGFLPFSEIHPDYYRLPVADREALIQQQAAQGDDDSDGDSDGEDSDEPDAESEAAAAGARLRSGAGGDGAAEDPEVEQVETASSVETIAGDDIEDAARRRAAALGNYKIQEVIKRRQVILVQVVKEERGNKGAALTTYLSLAGRYCVLMPNTNKGGGISRKIANAKDRRRLKEVLSQLNIPEGMAVIVRTAGSNRTKAEIKRDYEYLLRLWDQIREITLQSTAPCLIHEEANLIKRSIRDLYTRDMDEVLVEGEQGYKLAKSFMRSLMPSHAKKVQRYDDAKVPLFQHQQVEAQLDNIHNPTVQLKSGGYIVMNQTEALVAIDVNSGKATKERHIEETALKTNLEAADEVARQLKLRDLAGLIVIDFIDMDNPKNNKEVEQRLKEAMKQDRARIQLGRISPFGLLELSRQRLRPSLHETSTEVCRTCGGSGFVRSPESTALHVLRALEEEGVRRGGGEIVLTVPTPVALYTLNEKRARLNEIESRYRFQVRLDTDDSLIPPAYRLDRLSTLSREEAEEAAEETAEETAEEPVETPARPAETAAAAEAAGDEAGGRKRGKRGGRRKKKEVEPAQPAAEAAPAESEAEAAAGGEAQPAEAEATPTSDESEEEKKARRRRRGKRGGRRRSKRREEVMAGEGEADEATEAASAPAEAAAAETPGEPSEAVVDAGQEAAESAGEPAPAPAEAPVEAEAPAEAVAASEPEAEIAAAEASPEDSGEGATAAEATAKKPAARTTAGRKTKTTTAKTSRAKSARGKTAKAGSARKESVESEAPVAETAPAETAPAETAQAETAQAETENPEGEKTAAPAGTEAAAEMEAEQSESVLAAAAAESTGAGRGSRGRGRTASARTTSGGRSRRASTSRGGRGGSRAGASETSETTANDQATAGEVSIQPETDSAPEAAPESGAPASEAAEPSPAPAAETPGTASERPRPIETEEAEETEEHRAEPEPAATRANGREATAGEEAPFGEAAEPQGSDDLAERQERTQKPRRRGWWQKLLQ